MYLKSNQLLLTTLLVATSQLGNYLASATTSCQNFSVTQITIGADDRNNDGSDVLADIYSCQEPEDLPPLVVLACGGSVRKEDYSRFATGLATKGYVVMVLDHPTVFVPGTPPLNAATSVDISNAIAYAKDQMEAYVDTSQVVLVGHSFGASTVLSSLRQLCFFPLCGAPIPGFDEIPVPLDPGVKAAVTFGLTTRNPQTMAFDPRANNDGFPFIYFNGEGDSIEFGDPDDGDDTFGLLIPTKIYAVLENINHFSIANNVTSPREDVPSTFAREDQVAIVVDAFAFYIHKALNDNANNFCSKLLQHVAESSSSSSSSDENVFYNSPSYNVVDCDEEYA